MFETRFFKDSVRYGMKLQFFMFWFDKRKKFNKLWCWTVRFTWVCKIVSKNGQENCPSRLIKLNLRVWLVSFLMSHSKLNRFRRARNFGRADPGDEWKPEGVRQEVGRDPEEAEEVSGRARVLPTSWTRDRRQDRGGRQGTRKDGLQANCFAGKLLVLIISDYFRRFVNTLLPRTRVTLRIVS